MAPVEDLRVNEKKSLTLPTGEVISPDDIDLLLDIWNRCTKVKAACDASRTLIAKLISEKTPDSDKRTRRARGEKFEATIEMPGEAFDTKRLIHLWNTAPTEARDELLAIERVRVKKREFNKLETAKNPPKIEMLVRQIRAACIGEAGNPRIKEVHKLEPNTEVDTHSRPSPNAASEAG